MKPSDHALIAIKAGLNAVPMIGGSAVGWGKLAHPNKNPPPIKFAQFIDTLNNRTRHPASRGISTSLYVMRPRFCWGSFHSPQPTSFPLTYGMREKYFVMYLRLTLTKSRSHPLSMAAQ